jgi:hypothetical protein
LFFVFCGFVLFFSLKSSFLCGVLFFTFFFILLQLIILRMMYRVLYKQCSVIGFGMYQVICSIVTSEYSYNICEIFFDIV